MKLQLQVSKAGEPYLTYRYNNAPRDSKEPDWVNAYVSLKGVKLLDVETGNAIEAKPNHKLTLTVATIKALISDDFDFAKGKRKTAPATQATPAQTATPAPAEDVAYPADDPDMPL